MNKLLLVKTASRARRCVIHAANAKIQCKHPAYAVHYYSAQESIRESARSYAERYTEQYS